MLTSALLILAGLVLLGLGGEGVVQGGSSISARLRIPGYVVGATVIAFGTSAPELAVTVTAAVQNAPGLALGNVVGSNIANLGLILGLAALLRPVEASRKTFLRDLPVIGAVLVMLLIVAWDRHVSRVEGVVLLISMVIAMTHTLRGAHKARILSTHVGEIPKYRMLLAVPLVLVGLFLLFEGGQLLVDGAVGIAEALGVKQWVIGVIIVALGTSMPEVAASVVAAVRGHGEIAIGNVFGSNLFNTFFVLGTGATIRPVGVQINIHPDLLLFAALTVIAALPIAMRGRVTRPIGLVMLLGYVGFVVMRIIARV